MSHHLGALVAREGRLLRRDRTAWLSVAILVALAIVAFANGTSWARFQRNTQRTLRAEEAMRFDSAHARLVRLARGDSTGITGATDPRSPAVAGRAANARWLLLSPGPLAALAVGQSDLLPHATRITTASRRTAPVSEEIDNPVALMTGRLDLAYIMLVLYPLFVLAMTYDVVSGERERGTLSLLASQPVNVRRVLLAKLAVRGAWVIGAAVLISITAALVESTLGGGAALAASGMLSRLALWCTVVIAYGTFWFAAAVAVNALRRSSAVNAVMLLGLWFALVVVTPALVSNVVSVAYPVPSRISLATAVRDAQQQLATRVPSRADALGEFLAEHPQYRARADTADAQTMALANAARLDARLRPVFAVFDRRVRAQQDAADVLRFLSPALAAHGALLDVAGTGNRRWRTFEDTWIAYHARFTAFFFERVVSHRTMTVDDLAAVPAVPTIDEPARTLLAPLLASLAAILLPGLLIGIWGMRRLAHVTTVAI